MVDIRDEHLERIGREEFEAGKEQMLAEARGWRLAEIRRRRGFTQAQVAARMLGHERRLSGLAEAQCRVAVVARLGLATIGWARDGDGQ